VCLPILARLWQPGHTPGRLDLATELVRVVCAHLGARAASTWSVMVPTPASSSATCLGSSPSPPGCASTRAFSGWHHHGAPARRADPAAGAIGCRS